MPPKYAHPEFERRWLVPADRVPALAGARMRLIEDLYLQGGRLRLRAVHEQGSASIYKLGKKYPAAADMMPTYVSTLYLTEGEYRSLLSLPGTQARKRRYAIATGSLDIYEHPHDAPAIFECEFDAEAAASAFMPPSFVGREITSDTAYSGHAIAQRT